MCLKRKKLYEKEIAKYQGARLTLEQQIITLESATVNVETFNAMRTGATAMEQIHGELCVACRMRAPFPCSCMADIPLSRASMPMLQV